MTRTIFVVARYEGPTQTPVPHTRHWHW
jgi:hypothetical protein